MDIFQRSKSRVLRPPRSRPFLAKIQTKTAHGYFVSVPGYARSVFFFCKQTQCVATKDILPKGKFWKALKRAESITTKMFANSGGGVFAGQQCLRLSSCFCSSKVSCGMYVLSYDTSIHLLVTCERFQARERAVGAWGALGVRNWCIYVSVLYARESSTFFLQVQRHSFIHSCVEINCKWKISARKGSTLHETEEGGGA